MIVFRVNFVHFMSEYIMNPEYNSTEHVMKVFKEKYNCVDGKHEFTLQCSEEAFIVIKLQCPEAIGELI